MPVRGLTRRASSPVLAASAAESGCARRVDREPTGSTVCFLCQARECLGTRTDARGREAGCGIPKPMSYREEPTAAPRNCRFGTLDSRPHPGARSWAPERQSCKVQEQADGCRYRVPKVATQRPLRLEDLDRAARVSAFFAACVRAEALRLPGRPTMRRWPRADPCRLVRRQGRKQRCAAPGDRAMPRRQRTHPYPIRGMRPGRFRGRRRSLRWQTNRFA
jgi:hypothetical protein